MRYFSLGQCKLLFCTELKLIKQNQLNTEITTSLDLQGKREAANYILTYLLTAIKPLASLSL